MSRAKDQLDGIAALLFGQIVTAFRLGKVERAQNESKSRKVGENVERWRILVGNVT